MGDRPPEGEIHHTLSPPNSTVLQLWEGGARVLLCVHHGVTGLGQAPGSLGGCTLTPFIPSTWGSALLIKQQITDTTTGSEKGPQEGDVLDPGSFNSLFLPFL